MNQEKIGRFIAKARKEKGYTQEQLAEKLGVSNQTVSRWENGKNMPDVSLFESLCEALDITVNELLAGETIEKEKIETVSEQNMMALSRHLERKSKIKMLLEAGVFILVFLLIVAMNILEDNKTFMTNIYRSDYCDNVQISVPKFSYYRSTAGMDTYYVKLKTLKQTDEIDVFIDRYLSTFEPIECNGKTYYYNAKSDFTIFQYTANNDGIGFVNTIYIGYHDGKYCGDS